MITTILQKSFEEYKNNFRVMLSYGILFVFVILFIFFRQFFFASGTVHITYAESIVTIFGLFLSLVFLYFFSFFVSLTVYSTKRDVQKVSFDTYWNFLLKTVSVKIFFFYLLLSIIIYLIMLLGLYFNFQLFSALIAFIVSALLMYVPQSIILDEADLKIAVSESILFWRNNFLLNIIIILIGSVLLSLIIALEIVLNFLELHGIFFSFIFVLIFLVPFIEQIKSYSFILKFDLIKKPELLSARLKPKKPIKIDAARLRDKVKGGKI